MNNIYKDIEEYNPNTERKILIVFDDMIADMHNNEKLNKTVNELFIRERKLNISLAFITQLFFKVPKDVRLNITHFFITKLSSKRELHQSVYNHLPDIDFKDFVHLYINCTAKQYSFLIIDDTLASDNLLRFRKNLL